MKKTVTIKDFIDALGAKGLLAAKEGQELSAVLAGLYSENDTKNAVNALVSSVTYNSLEAGKGSLFVCKGAHFKE